MDFDINSFLELLIGSVKGREIPFIYYMIILIALLTFFAIRDFLLVKKEDLEENRKSKISDFTLDIVTSLVSSVICLSLSENTLVSVLLGILSAIYIVPKISPKIIKKKDSGKEDKKAIENNVNVVINNNTDDEKESLLPSFYDPNNLKLPENITSYNQLNIIMILEMYGYISPNQKFKMITQSLFETPDEQVEKLLEMYVLNKDELDEARAILNLIKLNNRLISKEEALHCIMEVKNKGNQKGG